MAGPAVVKVAGAARTVAVAASVGATAAVATHRRTVHCRVPPPLLALAAVVATTVKAALAVLAMRAVQEMQAVRARR